MIISKKILITEWNDQFRKKIIKFWENRKIIFTNISDTKMEGKRGSFLGNLFSFNMSNLMTTINIIKNNSNELICELDINTAMQEITTCNKKHWELELETFESVMLNDDYKENEWKELEKITKKDNVRWSIKVLFGGVSYYKKNKKL
jgi:hypothetical protein